MQDTSILNASVYHGQFLSRFVTIIKEKSHSQPAHLKIPFINYIKQLLKKQVCELRSTHDPTDVFFYIAKGSLAELRTQILIACEAGFIEETIYQGFDRDCETLAKMIGKLIKTRYESGER